MWGLLIIKYINQSTNNPRYQSNHNTTLKHVKNLESKKLVHMSLIRLLIKIDYEAIFLYSIHNT